MGRKRFLELGGSNAPLDHCQAAVLPQCSEPVLHAVALTPPSESLLDELRALVGDKAKRLVACTPEESLKQLLNRSRGRQRTIDRESHHVPGEVMDSNRERPEARGSPVVP